MGRSPRPGLGGAPDAGWVQCCANLSAGDAVASQTSERRSSPGVRGGFGDLPDRKRKGSGPAPAVDRVRPHHSTDRPQPGHSPCPSPLPRPLGHSGDWSSLLALSAYTLRPGPEWQASSGKPADPTLKPLAHGFFLSVVGPAAAESPWGGRRHLGGRLWALALAGPAGFSQSPGVALAGQASEQERRDAGDCELKAGVAQGA